MARTKEQEKELKMGIGFGVRTGLHYLDNATLGEEVKSALQMVAIGVSPPRRVLTSLIREIQKRFGV